MEKKIYLKPTTLILETEYDRCIMAASATQKPENITFGKDFINPNDALSKNNKPSSLWDCEDEDEEIE